MDIHTIDLPEGYSGSILAKKGTCILDFPDFAGTMTSGRSDITYYHIWLLTPEKVNMELMLFRFADGVWCDSNFFGVPAYKTNNQELLDSIKTFILRNNI